jgi:hypothetical protein
VFSRVAGVGDYAACRARTDLVQVDELTIVVLDLPALIDAKRAAGGPKDVEALHELELKGPAGPLK